MNSNLNAPKKIDISHDVMFQKFRIKNEAVGFQLVKLRSEARLVEATRTFFSGVYTFFMCNTISTDQYYIRIL